MPRAGEMVRITAAASVQFVAVQPFVFRVIRSWVEGSTPLGWAWMTGYVINTDGTAVERRDLFVLLAGLRPVNLRPDPRPRNGKPINTSPSIPQQRNRTSSPARSLR
jgi:hypothetical protein